jgi:hypothetical protein
VSHAYTICAVRSRESNRLPCALVWVAWERKNLLVRQGWIVTAFDYDGLSVPDRELEALARAEIDGAVSGTEPR